MKAILRNFVSTSILPHDSGLSGSGLPVVRASQPIRAQLSGHVICRDQSGVSDAGSVGLTTGPRWAAPAERRRPECGHWDWTERSGGCGGEHRQCGDQGTHHDGHDHRQEGLHLTMEKSHHQGLDIVFIVFSLYNHTILLINKDNIVMWYIIALETALADVHSRNRDPNCVIYSSCHSQSWR